MGTKKSKPYDKLLVGSVVVAGYSESTKPLIKTFRRLCDNPNQSFIGRYTYQFMIDEEIIVHLNIQRPMEDLSQSLIPLRRHYVGLMLTYNVRDEESFQTAKQIAISPHPEKVTIQCHSKSVQ